MKQVKQKLDIVIEHGTSVPSYTPELGTRISEAIKAAGGLRKAAKFTGASEDSLAQWRDGKTRPTFFGLQGLAQASDKSLDWLATGQDSVASQDIRPLDSMALRDSIKLVDDWLDENDREMTPGKKADVVTTIYEMAMEEAGDGQPKINSNQVNRILRLVS